MSKSDSDSKPSYCSDNSEFNYISGPYMIEAVEVKEVNSNEAALPTTDDNLDHSLVTMLRPRHIHTIRGRTHGE